MSQIVCLFICLFINKFLKNVLKIVSCSFCTQHVTVFQIVSLLFWVSVCSDISEWCVVFVFFLSQGSFGKTLHTNPSLYNNSCQAKFGPNWNQYLWHYFPNLNTELRFKLRQIFSSMIYVYIMYWVVYSHVININFF